jgi:hypothetical protein
MAVLIVAAVDDSRLQAYAVDPETAYAFEDAGVQLAREARSDRHADRKVYVAERFARDWASVPFLIGGGYIPLPDGTAPQLNAAQPATLFLWPYEDWAQALSTLSAPVRLKVSAGPQAKGDLDAQPHGHLKADRTIMGTGRKRSSNGLRCWHSIEMVDQSHWRLRTLGRLSGSIVSDQIFLFIAAGQPRWFKTANGDGFHPPQPSNHQPAGEGVETTQPVIDQAILLGGSAASGPGAVGP